MTVADILVTHNYTSSIDWIELVVYGGIIGLTALYLLCFIVFVCCKKTGCRFCLYFTGGLLFFICLATFAALIIISYLSTVLYSGCRYMQESATNPTSFKGTSHNIQKICKNLGFLQKLLCSFQYVFQVSLET